MRRKPDETLGQLLRRWREGAGLSQEKVAEEVGARQSRWSRWECGIERPGLVIANRIAKMTRGEITLEMMAEAP